jgi:TATA-binding protein-associated factor Taf7
MIRLIYSLAAVSAIGNVMAVSNSNNIMESNYPASSEQWMSVSKTISFQPAEGLNQNVLRQRRFLSYFEDSFADGMETQYNDYAQAWRLLGFFTDCQTAAAAQRRKLEDNGGDVAEGDEEQGGEEQNDEENAAEYASYCKRYLLWAAVSYDSF